MICSSCAACTALSDAESLALGKYRSLQWVPLSMMCTLLPYTGTGRSRYVTPAALQPSALPWLKNVLVVVMLEPP